MKIYQIKIETGYVTVWADSFMDACKEVREAGFTVLGGHQVAQQLYRYDLRVVPFYLDTLKENTLN